MPTEAELGDLVARALRLEEASAAGDDPETEPHKSRYAARQLLAEAVAAVEADDGDGEGDGRRPLRLAWLRVRLAANRLETEEASEAHRMLTRLATDEPPQELDEADARDDSLRASLRIQLFNWLGCASCHLSRHADAIGQLRRAEAAFLRWRRRQRQDQQPEQHQQRQDEQHQQRQDEQHQQRQDEQHQQRQDEQHQQRQDEQHQQRQHQQRQDEQHQQRQDQQPEPDARLSDLFPAAAAALEAAGLADPCALEPLHTRTLFYLAQACGKADQPAESARYCQMTLERQLALASYVAAEWSLNCAALSQYYLSVRDFPRAHRCLGAASAVFAEAEASVASPEAMSVHDPDSELQHNRASIRRCWLKYALALLEYSRDLAQQRGDTVESQEAAVGEYEDLFPSVDASQHAGKIGYRPAVNFEQARDMFLFAQRQVALAKEFFRLDEHCTDYAELVRDHSRAFLHLIQFELDPDRRARMHKRRADMLRDLLGQLSQQFYLLICRQLRFELAETLVDMLDIKLEALEAAAVDRPPAPAAVAKANQLGRDAVAQFDLFVDSFRTADAARSLPDRFEASDERPVLLAFFHAGRVSARLLETSRERRLANLRRAEASYRLVSDYCARVPEAAAKMAPELGLLREMLALMPVKVQAAMDKFDRAG